MKEKAVADTLRERLIHYAYDVLRPKVLELATETLAIEAAPELSWKMDGMDLGAASRAAGDIPKRKVPAADKMLELLGDVPDAAVAARNRKELLRLSGGIVAQEKEENWPGNRARLVRKCAAALDLVALMNNLVCEGRLDGFLLIYEKLLPKRANRAKRPIRAAQWLLKDPMLREAARIARELYESNNKAMPALPKKMTLEAKQLEFTVCMRQANVAAQESPSFTSINETVSGMGLVFPESWIGRLENSAKIYASEGLRLKQSGIVPILSTAAAYLRAGDYVGFHGHYLEIKKNGGETARLAENEIGAMDGIIAGQIRCALSIPSL